MLDSIRTLTDLPACGEARIRGQDIIAARQRRTLRKQVERWTRDCVDQAQRDAEVIRANAVQQGYSQGMLRAAEDLATALRESQAMGQALRCDLTQAAAQLLGGLLSRSEWLDEMLESWLAEQVPHGDAVLQVLLPMRCKPQGAELQHRLQALWSGTVVLEYQPQERYLLRLADQVLEFDIGATRQRLEPKLLALLKNLPASATTLDQGCVQKLRDLCVSLTETKQ
ncbi:hypothetical protein ACQR3P_27225 [Rhodococcus sp. IEGM1300]